MTGSTSHSPAATPAAEGIYAITSTRNASHLAYHLTIPEELGPVQKSLGLDTKGSFVLSAKNPTASGPANASLDNPAEYPKEIMSKFRGLRWTPLIPEMLDYEHTQFLIMGGEMGDLETAVEQAEGDAQDGDKVTPLEELEKLEEEVCTWSCDLAN